MILVVIASGILGLVIYTLIKLLAIVPPKGLPGPKPLPIVGNSFFFLLEKNHDEMHCRLAEEFKEKGLYLIHNPLIGMSTVFLTKAEWAKYVLSRPDDFPRGDFLETFFVLLGKGLLTSVGDEHRFQKKLLAKAFSINYLMNYVSVFDRHTKELVKTINGLSSGKRNGANLPVRDYTSVFSFNIIAEVAFGYQFDSENSATYLNAIKDQTESLSNMRLRILIKIFPFLKYVPGIKEMITGEKGRKVLNDVLLTRKKKVENGTLTDFEKKDILSIMMSEKDEKTGKMFSDQLIKDTCFTFMLAGYETTATAIPIVLYHLAKYPEMQEKARQEILAALSENEDDELQLSNIELPYTSAFIKESLRLFPVVNANGRIAAKDCHFGDFFIPKGNFVFFSNVVLNRDPETFERPDDFIPERFLPNSDIKSGTSMTFGYGPFSCIGKKFALLETKVAVVRLLQNFKISVDPEFLNFKKRVQLLTVRLTPQIHIRFQDLKNVK